MKKNVLKILGASFLCLAMGIGVGSSFMATNINHIDKTEAASHPANFDPYTYSGTYYSGISSSATEGTSGSLRTSLTSLIHPTSVPTYGSSGATHLSTVLQYADEDPTNSNNMIYLYTRDSVTKNAANSWNREHVWPQSLSNDCWGTGKAGADLLHIRPTYNTTNSTRGNNKYAEINGGTAKVYNGITYGYVSGSYFMPLDSVKGDVARIIMYVWVAYYDDYGSKLPAITNVFSDFDTLMSWHCSDKPDVMEGNRNDYSQTSMQKNRNPFVDHPEYAWKIFGSKCSSSVLNNAKATYPADGSSGGGTVTSTVTLDKASASVEVGSTVKLSATSSNGGTITWTKSNNNVSLSSSSSSSGSQITVTGSTAGTTTIYAQNTDGAKAHCEITVTNPSGSGETTDFTIDFRDGGNCTSTTGDFDAFTFSSAKESAGSNPAYSSGELRLYYSSTGNGCSVTLTPATNYSIKGITITASSASYTPAVKYQVNGGSATSASFNNTTLTMSNINATSSLKFWNANTSNTQLRIQTIKVDLENLAPSSKTLSSIAVSEMTTSYTIGDTFSFDGTCTATFSDNSKAQVTPTSVSSPDMSQVGNKTVTVTYTYSGVTKSTTYQINVKAPATLSSLSISGTLTKTSYFNGDAFDPTGLTVTGHYSDSTTKNVTSEVDWTPSPLTTGTTTVTANFGGKTATYSGITVSALTLSSISISGQTTTYTIGDEFSFDGSVMATYSNGFKKQVEPTSVDSSSVNTSVEGTYNVLVVYTENGITKSASYTVSVVAIPFVNTIEACYELSNNDNVSGTVYGLYVGYVISGKNSDHHAMIMNGEYGIELYGATPDSTWVENQTYLAVSNAKVSIYNNLYELADKSTSNKMIITKVTDVSEQRQNIAPISIYNVDGEEKSSDKTLANRLSMISGVVKTINGEDTFNNNEDNTIVITVNGADFQLFIKKSLATNNVNSVITDSYTNKKEITIKGFTSIYNTSFQLQFQKLVLPDDDYTAEDFAQDLLDLTSTICASSANKESDLSGVWMTLITDKWSVLPDSQKDILHDATANEGGNVIERAMARYDIICRKYGSCTNFINRATANHSNGRFILFNNQSALNSIVIIATLSTIVIVCSVGAYLLFKKKKEQ